MPKVQPVPHRAPMVDQNIIPTNIWAQWFERVRFVLEGLGEEALSTASNGYLKLGGGLYIQWGTTGSTASGSSTAVSFPVAFPNACLQVIPGIKDNSAVSTASTGQWGTGNYSTTGFNVYNRTSVAAIFNWLAVGY